MMETDAIDSKVIRLGPFRLLRRIGRGGMGEVWLGNHVGQNVPVAIKVMTGARARKPKYIEAFYNEVRSVARLSHPGIVMVFDYGKVPESTQEDSQNRFVKGCPYLVMELASGGSLGTASGKLEWPQLRNLLLSILDALAHAHARGVIHRDLKPANILLGTASDLRPGVKLSDFGIAHARSKDAPTLKGAGTPRYMAPEQIVRRWRDHGPWTDIYALGCLAYQLCSGRPPFTMRIPKEVLEAHLTRLAPPLAPQMMVPAEFERWIARCMVKAPQGRFRRAADAAWALMKLGGPYVGPKNDSQAFAAQVTAKSDTVTFTRSEEPAPQGSDTDIQLGLPGQLSLEEVRATTQDDPAQVIESLVHNSRSLVALRTSPKDSEAHEIALNPGFKELEALLDVHDWEATEQDHSAAQPPPMVDTWRRMQSGAAPQKTSMQLVGAGLGLFGLRQIPLVGRDRARDILWRELREVRRRQRPRFVALVGPAGVGKSRLVEWVAERAHELGAATLLKAEHQQELGGDALADMLTTHLQCQNMTNSEVSRRIERQLRDSGVTHHYEWRALAEIIQPSDTEFDTDTSRLVYFPQESARFGVIQRLITRMARQRPVIVWLDDVQWGHDALALAHKLMTATDSEASSCLVIVTVQQESLVEREPELRLFNELLGLEASTQLDVGPLNSHQRRELVERILRLSGDLAERVAERTGGNPLFAVQLVGDWVHRGVLEVGRDGFELPPNQRLELPDSLHAAWNARIERMVEGLPAAVIVVLEVAAALGPHIDPWEWHVAATESPDVTASVASTHSALRVADVEQVALRALEEAHLVVHRHDSWSFVHGMLRESVERSARDHGRWMRHHEACAVMLEKCYPLGGRSVAERKGRHLFAAGKPSEAISPLLLAAIERREASEYGAAQALLWLREKAMVAAEVDEEDPAWGVGWVLRCRLDEDRHKLDQALRWAKTAVTQAERWGWKPVRADALCAMGTIFSRRGQQREASEAFIQAQQDYLRAGDRSGVARCLRGLGSAAAQAGKFEEARRLITTARSLFEQQKLLFEVAHCRRVQANIAWTEGKPDQAGELYQETLAMCEQIGDRLGVGLCLAGMAEVARVRGKLVEAEELYRTAINGLRQLDSGWEYYQGNLALILLARGAYREARGLLQRVSVLAQQQEQLGLLACVQVALAFCTAGMKDWTALDGHLERATDLLRLTGLIEPDVAWCSEMAGQLASDAQKEGRAQAALAIAGSQYEALADEEACKRVAILAARCKEQGGASR